MAIPNSPVGWAIDLERRLLHRRYADHARGLPRVRTAAEVLRSWHLGSGLISRSGRIHTLCGRWAALTATSSPTLPPGEKSCESCFRNREIANQ